MSRSYLFPLLALAAGFAGCAGSAAGPAPGARAQALPFAGRVECAGGCRVELFDGNGLRPQPVARDGTVSVPVPLGGGEVLLFISAPGTAPQVRAVGAGRPVGLVRLQPAPDPGLGYLAAGLMRVTAARGGPRMEPLAGAEVVLARGTEQIKARSDQGGAVVLPLPPGSYGVVIAGNRQTVEVRPGETVVLPVVVGKRLVE